MQVRIFKPAKTAMQSGQRNTKEWVLEPEPAPKEIDPLMGWTSSRDTMQQVQLHFATLEEAKATPRRTAGNTRSSCRMRGRQTQGLCRQFRLHPRRPLDALTAKPSLACYSDISGP